MLINNKPQCPDHGDTMKREEHEVRTGPYRVLRKIMIIWNCKKEGCIKWCEQQGWVYIWP